MTTNWGNGNLSNSGDFGNFGNFGNFGQTLTIASPSISTPTNNNNNNQSQIPVNNNSNTNISSAELAQKHAQLANNQLQNLSKLEASNPQMILPPGLQKTGTNPPLINGSIQQSQPSHPQGLATNGATPPPIENLTDIERFGLKGLVPLVSLSDQTSLTKLALGADLLMAGLQLDKNDEDAKLLSTFQSPWVETSIKDVEPSYKLPDSVKKLNDIKYKSLDLQSPENRMSNYPEDTLFFIFYSKPKDMLQELAARELRERNWRFHKVLKVWLAKVKDVEPVQDGPTAERGFYVFFDPQNWQKVTKEFLLEYNSIL